MPALTICIPVRNRSGQRLINNLTSLQQQNTQDFRIVVVNYGSAHYQSQEINQIGKDFNIEVLNIETTGVWNKSHALNIALKQTNTPFFMSTDVDMIYRQDFIANILLVLDGKHFPSCQCKYLTDNITKHLRPPFDFMHLDKSTNNTSKSGAVGACFAIDTWWLKKVGGWDEFYTGWGKEDQDIVTRALSVGFTQTWITDKTQFFHQYHDDEPIKANPKIQADNAKHYEWYRDQVERNPKGWGIV